MKRAAATVVKIVLTAVWLGAMAFSPAARAEKCDPRNPDVCVGGPTGQPCGSTDQICCPSGPTECKSDGDLCLEGYCRAMREYTALCSDGYAYVFYSAPSLVELNAQDECTIHNGGAVVYVYPYPI